MGAFGLWQFFEWLLLGFYISGFMRPLSLVTGLGAFFGSIPIQSGFKKCEAYFLKEAKTAPFQ
jgi:hypothetical protein